MTFSKILLIGPVVLSASFLMGCSANSVETSQQSYTSKASYQKPGASVNYSYDLTSKLSAGDTISFKLTLDETYSQGQLDVILGAEGGIVLLAPTQAQFDMSGDAEHEMDISFTANSNGRHYINVNAQAIDASGRLQPRIFSIPVQVGPVSTKKPNPNMAKMPDGKNVIEMEAEEEIIFK